MRIPLTFLTAVLLFLRTPLPQPRGVPAKTEGTVFAQQAAPKPQEDTGKPYACPAVSGGPLSKLTGGAASTQTTEKKQDGHGHAASQEFCLELNQAPPAVEECVRRILPEAGWTLAASSQEKSGLHAGRRVEPDELRRVAQTEIGGGKIHWEEGMVNAEIRLVPLSEGVTQVRIRTRIVARGTTTLRLMRPSPWWPLASTGALEEDVLAALETHCRVKP